MKEIRNIESCKDELITGYLTGEITGEEKASVEKWIHSSEENNREIAESLEVMENAALYYKTRQYNTTSAWENVRSKIRQQPPPAEVQGRKPIRISFTTMLRYAAVLLFAVVSGTMVYYLAFTDKPSSLAEIHATDQVLGNQVLPDGTRVALNNNSVIHFPETFTGNTREVDIEGEAFFEVVPDSAHPFIISAGKAKIRVLGTSFNILAYPEMETVEVVVKTGRVQLSLDSENNKGNSVILRPGEKGTFNRKNEQLVKSVNPDPNFNSWKTRTLIFRETPMSEVIKCLEKIYPVTVVTSQPSVDSLKLTAQFDDQSIDYVLEVIRLTFRLDLKSDGGHFLFTLSDN